MRRTSDRETETRFYSAYTDDFVESKNQAYTLPEDFVWVHENPFYRMASACVFRLAQLFSIPYCRLAFDLRVENQKVLARCADTGYFVYGNHTQPVGDVFIPARGIAPRRCHVLAGPANLGIPVLGPILPMMGALPVANHPAGIRQLQDAVARRIGERRAVVIYPEAHVWPWYTGIRPFGPSAFGYPVSLNAPCFAMTTTYQRRRRGSRPRITLYFDGPFYPDSSLPRQERKEKLRDQVRQAMLERSEGSTYTYVRYAPAAE